MQIRVSSRDCRAAVGASIVALEARVTDYRDKVLETSFKALLEGAVHNGLDVNDARKQEMREMAERDVAHMLEQHPVNETLQVMKNFVDMLAFHRGDDIVIDDQDFALIKDHLPKAPADEPAAV